MEALQVRVLGSLELAHGSGVAPVRGRLQRVLLAELAAAGGAAVPAGSLVESLWGTTPPDGAEHALQQHITSLRKLVTSIGHPQATAVIVHRGPGYALAGAEIDCRRFESIAEDGFRATADRRWSVAAASFDAALRQWRGAPFDDAADSPRLVAAARRLISLRRSVVEGRFDALLATGRAGELVPDLEAAVEDHPYHESFRRQLMLALYRSGRQTEALQAYQQARTVLVEEVGIEPSVEMRRLEQAILTQSPELDRPASHGLAGDDGPAGADAADLFATLPAAGLGPIPSIELPDGRQVVLGDGVTVIGRDDEAGIRLVDRRVSRRHAELAGTGGRWSIRDLGSTNGTAVDGRPLAAGDRDDQTPLIDGAAIDVGGVRLRFHLG